jgi:hypothetical protein
MYLGYKHRDQVSRLASKLTMLAGKEIYIYHFDETTFHGDDGKEHKVQGIYCPDFRVSIAQMEFMLDCDELPNIHVNKKDSTQYETMLVIGEKESVQAWYDMMRQGLIAQNIVRKYGTDGNVWDTHRDEINQMEMDLDNSLPRHIVKPEMSGIMQNFVEDAIAELYDYDEDDYPGL